jgi:uncharacterized membrane protein YbhN (UPF0104 family)
VKPALKWGLRLFFGALVLVLLLSRREVFAQLLQTLSGVPLWVLLTSVLFYLLGQALCAWKWQLLLQKRGAQVSFLDCATVYLAGMFGNLWLPTNIGGDALRATLLNRKLQNNPTIKQSDVGLSDVAASIVVDRLTGFAALLAIGIVAILVHGSINGQGVQIVVGASVMFAVLIGGWLLLSKIKHRKIESLKTALDFYLKPENRSVMLIAMALSFAFQISQVFLNIGLARASNLPVPDAVFWWLGPLLSLSGLVPVGIGGLGVREAAAVGLLGGSVASGKVVAWSLLWQTTVWLSSLLGVFFLRANKPPKE